VSSKDLIRNSADKTYYLFHKTMAWMLVALFFAMIFVIAKMSWPIFERDGLAFITGRNWLPAQKVYGALPFIYGTIVTSFLSLLIAVPLSISVALFITDMATPKVGKVVGFFVEMLAAIPSVVYGMWGLFVLVPFLRTFVQPFLNSYVTWIPMLNGPPFGLGMMTAAIVLSIMITPTITAICREVFATVPQIQKDAARGLGANRWEVLSLAVLRGSVPGIIGATILGLGRAMGETMAVTMVIGNVPRISAQLFEPAQTMASLLANQYAEADGAIHVAALTGVGLMLFLVALVVNLLARLIVWRVRSQQ
jgi:phosphate transport system permease protein